MLLNDTLLWYAGRRLEYDNPLFLNLVSSINLNFEVGGSFGVINFLPWLAKIIPASFLGTDKIQHSLQHHHSYLRVHNQIHCITAVIQNLSASFLFVWQDIIKEHQDNYNPENEPSDYIDYFLLEQKKNTDASSTFTGTWPTTSNWIGMIEMIGIWLLCYVWQKLSCWWPYQTCSLLVGKPLPHHCDGPFFWSHLTTTSSGKYKKKSTSLLVESDFHLRLTNQSIIRNHNSQLLNPA